MSKKTRKPDKPIKTKAPKRKALVISGLILSLLLASAAFGKWGGFFAVRKPQPAPTGSPAPTGTAPTSPSKEYIYAGGRLVATEEPPAAGPTINPLSTTSGTLGSTVPVTITGSNLTGATAINISSTGVTAAITNVQATQITATFTIAANAAYGTHQVTITTPGGTSNQEPFDVLYPTPNINGSTPTSTQQSTATAVTLSGTGFVPGSSIAYINTTTVLTIINASPTSLKVQVQSGDVATTGRKPITVVNPTPGGGPSNTVYLDVTSGTNNPVPQIDSISPLSVAAGSAAFTLFINSSNSSFRTGATVQVNGGTPRTPSSVSTSQLQVLINASDVATAGTVGIVVINPAPGGGPSSPAYLTVTGSSSSGTGLTGDYFNNTTLTGTPVLSRTDPTIDFAWGTGSPAAGINVDGFGVRWTGQVQALTTGKCWFFVKARMGVKLWVGGDLLINAAEPSELVTFSNSKKLIAGQKYDIRLEVTDAMNKAEVHLLWSQLDPDHQQIIPQSQLFPPASAPLPPALYQGVLEVTDCSTISGWAADANQSSTAINADIYVNGSLYTTVTANQSHANVPVAGNHGFSYTVPAALKDGVSRSVAVKVGGTTLLTGSPKTLTCSGATLPNAPTGLTLTVVPPTGIDLRWTDTNSGHAGYSIERKDGASGTYTPVGSTGLGGTTFRDTGLSTSTLYTYRVRASNSAGYSAYCQEQPITIPGGSGVPAAPSNLIATWSQTSATLINLAWTDNSSNESGFRIFVKQSGASSYTLADTIGPNATSYSSKNRTPGTQYCYRVEAYNGSGANSSGEACATSGSGTKGRAFVSLLSGDASVGSFGYVEGAGSVAKWGSPTAGVVGIDPVSGVNSLFVADTVNQRIRMIYLQGPAAGTSVLLAGSGVAGYWDGDGDPYMARYNNPRGIAALKNDQGVVDALVIADTDNHTIRLLLAPLGGTDWRPDTLSGQRKADDEDGTATTSGYNAPYGITIGNDGGIYVADSGNGAIRRLDWDGNSTTFLRMATWQGSTFKPIGITASSMSQYLYISSFNSNTINQIQGGTIDRLSSSGTGFVDGAGLSAKFSSPYHLVWADTGGAGSLYIVDMGNNRIRQFDLQANQVSTTAGSGTSGYVNGSTGARFNSAAGIGLDASGQLYVVEPGNSSIRQVGDQ